MNFKKDLEFGNIYEKKALDYFKYTKYKIKEGYYKEYDIKLKLESGKSERIEVKCDRLAHKTNNIVIEYEYNNKPSGISTTRADKWIYFIHNTNKVFIIPVDELKNIIKTSKTINGGDNKLSKMYLLSMSLLDKFLVA
jgi:hypothetical protein